MPKYSLAYRLGFTPWERYPTAAAASIAALLDREEAERSQPPGRALDLGCGRGLYSAELARRGWDVVGLDTVPAAIEAAGRTVPDARFVVGDVARLDTAGLGSFDFFLDVGCFQGLGPSQRRAAGRGVSGLCNPRATLLLLAFQPTRARSVVGGLSRADLESAFPRWDTLSVEAADTTGLGWPLTRTSPQWYRLRRQEIAT
jgi:SAM-dependent methyltransferase